MTLGDESDDISSAEIEAAIKLQAFTRGAMNRIRVAGMLGSVIEGMLEEQTLPDSGDDGSYYISGSDDGDNMSLASDDFNADELQEYLERKYDVADELLASDDELERIIRPSARKQSWIVHSPSQERAKLENWRTNAKDISRNSQGSVKQRASLFNTSKSNLEIEDSTTDLADTHGTPPVQDKPKVKKIGETMSKLLSPKRNSDMPSPGTKLKAALSVPKRKSDLPSPRSKLKIPLPKTVKQNSSALKDKVSEYTTSLSPKIERKKKKFQNPRRNSDAFMDKVTVFKDFGDKMKTAKDSLAKKPNILKKKKKDNYNIDTHSTPKAKDLRKSIEAGLFAQNIELPKIQLDEPEVEGIQAKIAQLGFDKTRENPTEELLSKERTVDFAAHQYLLHDSATKIQAVARGFLYRKKDQEAMLRVQRWLQQNQDIEKALTGDPTEVSEEERAKAVEEFVKTIECLVPPELTRGASRAAGMGASFVAQSLSFREQSRRDSGLEHPYKPERFSSHRSTLDDTQEEPTPEVSELESNRKLSIPTQWHNAADGPQEATLPEASAKESNKKSSIRSRQQQMNAAATSIQAVTRGFLVRKSDFGAAVTALNWLKEYKLLDELEETKKSFSHDQSKLAGALDAINKVQFQLHRSATTIQAIARGYIVRKFDMKTMKNVMEWIRACKLEMEDEQAPKTEELEDAWIFLENANQWIRESEKRNSLQVDTTVDEKIPVEELDVNGLLSTLEFVRRDKSLETSQKPKEDPTDNELKRLQKWLTESDYSYVSSSDEDMHQLWAFLGSNGVNVDTFRREDFDESQGSGISIQYIDEDLSRFFGKVPSIGALIEFWSFTRKHDIESLASDRQELHEEQDPQQPTEETIPVETEETITVETETESKPEKAEPKPVDTENEETQTVADTASDSEGSIEPPKQPAKKVKRRTATNIDGMMSSLKWLKKKGLDLNRIKGGTSIGMPKGGAAIAASGTLAKLKQAQDTSSSSARIPDAGPRMSSALNWLEKKGLDISETVSKQLAADPTPDELNEVVKRMSKQQNTKDLKLPTAEEMKQTMSWWKIQESTKNLKKKKKKKGKKPENVTGDEQLLDDYALEPPVLASTDSMQYALAFLQKTGKANDKANGETTPNSGLEKTFELMKKQVEVKRESKIIASREKNPAEKDPSPTKTKEPSESDIYEADALKWLNTGDADIQDAAYFQKLDKTLSGKDTHTNEQRAKEIAKAMKWVDKQGFFDTEEDEKPETISEEDQSISNSDSDEPPKPLAPPKAVQKKVDAKSAKKGKKEEGSKTSKSKGSRSRSKSKSSKRTKARSNSPKRKESRSRSASPASPARTISKKKKKSKEGKASKNASLPSVKSMLSPRKKKKTLMGMKTGEQNPERDYELAVVWLTSRDETMEDAKYFKKLDGMVPQNPDHSVEDRARELVKALNWVRRTSDKNKIKESDAAPKSPKSKKSTKTVKSPKAQSTKKKVKLRKEDDKEKVDRTVINLKDLVKVQKTRKAEIDTTKKSESTPEQDYENALSFIRIKEEGGDTMECEDANYFKKLDNMLPKKGTSEDRAKEMVKMLGWLRKKGKA
ncbi:MAG: hypothetical protein SGBAC_005945 [Bacillariaceae sp.]